MYNPSYNYKTGFSNIKYTMNGRPASTSTAITPGPGAYQLKGEVNQKKSLGKIGKSNRASTYSLSSAPGPGSYNQSTILGRDGPKTA